MGQALASEEEGKEGGREGSERYSRWLSLPTVHIPSSLRVSPHRSRKTHNTPDMSVSHDEWVAAATSFISDPPAVNI